MSDTLTSAQLREIAEREAKATKGPWEHIPDSRPDVIAPLPSGFCNEGSLTKEFHKGPGQLYCHDEKHLHVVELAKYDDANPDATFIAAARTDVPALLKHIEALEEAARRGHVKPTHGPCCTCQRCGKDYDKCRCDLDDTVDENEKLKLRIAEIEKDRDEWKATYIRCAVAKKEGK